MAPLQILLAVITTFVLAVGQILFKMASNKMSDSTLPFWQIVLTREFLIAMVVYAIGTVLWLLVLRNSSLSKAYPISALAFFFVPFLAWAVFREAVDFKTIIGAFVIFLGVCISQI